MRHLSRTLVTTSLLTAFASACSDSSATDPLAADPADARDATGSFTLSSRAVVDGELLAEFQCEEKIDGIEESIPLEWSGVPEGTESLAVTMHHYPDANDETSVNGYLQLWNIDPETTAIEHGAADDGPWFLGANKDGAITSYSSPCSPAAGAHSYTITLYALSSDPVLAGLLPAESSVDVDYAALRGAAEASGIIAETTLTFDSTSGADSAGENEDAGGCEGYDGAFAPLGELVSHDCDETYLSITTETGLPPTQGVGDDERIMVGLTSWIQRVPIPYTYEWRVPLDPAYSDGTIEASPRGPIAVAVDGVPIFHYERRPDVSTALAAYTAENDTVLAGELDQCGGHAGQGDDYHYHYTPVCLLDGHDLSQPLAFGLDGAPVYFGEGGTDYYGGGRFDALDNFPEGVTAASLDECNAILQPDGTYRHYTTKTPPYLIGCHHAPFDTALQIEPAPMTGREQGVAVPTGGTFGEPVTTLITDFVHDEEGEYTLTYQSIDGGGGTSELVYREVSATDTEVCWEFEFRASEGQPGETRTACRTNDGAGPPADASAFEHGHDHGPGHEH